MLYPCAELVIEIDRLGNGVAYHSFRNHLINYLVTILLEGNNSKRKLAICLVMFPDTCKSAA
jgi:hypothetical protein